MSYIVSPNMNLSIPTVGVEPGPTYAQDINNSLTAIDQHNHTAGQGVQIPPSGLNINADLPYNNNNLTGVRSVRFQSQTAVLSLPSDLGCLYESGVDLYYNDGSGNQIRITQSGGIAGSPGSISNLVPPASVTYVSGSSTFVFQSNATTAANLDVASVIMRNLTPGSFGLTLQPPASLAADYSIILPTLPSVTSVTTLDAAGNMGTQTYDQVGQNMTAVGANAIAATRTRTTGQVVGIGGVAVSPSSGTFVVNSPVPATQYPVTNLSVTITTSGRPVRIECKGAAGGSHFRAEVGTPIGLTMWILRDAVAVSAADITLGAANDIVQVPPAVCSATDIVTAGTYNYTVNISLTGNVTGLIGATDVILMAYEL